MPIRGNWRGNAELMHEIRPGLWLGSIGAETQKYRELEAKGITHVLQVGTSTLMQPSHRNNLEYCCIEVLDAEGEDLVYKLKEHKAHEFISKSIENGGGVLIHCFAGISRSATTVISYLMSKENLSFEDAIAEVMQIRQTISPNRGFCRQLKILQEDCGGQLANYKPEMLQGANDLTWRQWMGILSRARERIKPLQNSTEDEQSDPGSPLPLDSNRR